MAESLDRRLSQIVTEWSLLRQAHAEAAAPARAAQEKLLELYGGSVRRYLRACLRDADAAEEVFQNFAVRFLSGSLKGADPKRGRFRHYLKGALSHLVADFHQRRRRAPLPLETDAEPVAPAWTSEDDAAFAASWREELLAQAWKALAEDEAATGQPFHTALLLRREHPEVRSEALAALLAVRLNRPITAAGIRQTLHRARERFADLLLAQVAATLDGADVEELGQELADLQLLHYCDDALERLHAKERL